VSVLNGADGLGEIAAGLVSQGMSILESVRKGMPGLGQPDSANGRVTSGQVVPDRTASPPRG
jgi:flotillin